MAGTQTAGQRALDAIGAVEKIGFVEFTTELVTDVYNVIIKASLEQLNTYADFVSQIAQSIEDYEQGVIGTDENAQKEKADDYIVNVLRLADSPEDISGNIDITGKEEALKQHFLGVTISDGSEEKSIDKYDKQIPADDLRSFVTAKLSKNARDSYNLIKTVLKIGMQKVVVTDGEIHTRLTFHVDATDTYDKTANDYSGDASNWGIRGSLTGRYGSPAGRVAGVMLGSFIGGGVSAGYGSRKYSVSVVNEKSTAATNVTADILGDVRIQFRTETFPTIEE